MKIRRKTDNVVKEVPDELAQKILQDPKYEQVQDTPIDTQDPSSVPVTTRLFNSLILGPIGTALPEISAGARALGDKILSPSSDLSELYQQKLAEPTDVEKKAEALSRGLVQGTSLGASDEIIGAVGATGESVKNLVTGEESPDWTDLYRQYQLAEQERNKKVYEENPLTYLTGEVGGGVVAGLATAGAGGVGSTAIRKAAEQGAAPVAKLLGKAAIGGAGMGAVQSAAISEGNLDSIESRAKLIEDIKTGAEVGGLVAPVFAGGSALLSAAGEKIANSASKRPFLRQMMTLWKDASTNPIEGTEQGQIKVNRALVGQREDIANQILQADNVLTSEFQKVIDDATAAGIRIPLDPNKPLNTLFEIIQNDQILAQSKEAKKVLGILNQFINASELKPNEALSLKWTLKEFADKLEDPKFSLFIQGIVDDIDNTLKTMPKGFGQAFEQANQQLAQFRGSVQDVLLGKAYSSIDPVKRKDAINASVEQLLQGYSLSGRPRQPFIEQIVDMYNGLQQMEATNPGTLVKLGINNLDDFLNKIQNSADFRANVSRVLGSNSVPLSGTKDIAKAQIMAQGAATPLGRLSGGVQTASQISHKMGNLFNAPLERITEIGNRLMQSNNPHAKSVGEYLINAVNNKDVFKKNSALFIINQNPALRDLVGSFFGGDEN